MTPPSELNALPCPLIITDQEGRIVFINDCAITSFELTKPHNLERIEQLLPAPAKVFMQTHLWPMLRANRAINEIYLKINLASGITIPVLLNAEAGQFNEKPCYRWVIMPAAERASFEQELLKARQQLQEYAQEADSNRHLLQTVLDGAEDIAILAISKLGKVRFGNKGAETLLERQTDNLINHAIDSLFHTLNPCPQLEAFYKTMSLGSLASKTTAEDTPSPYVFETNIHRKNNTFIDVQIQIRCLDSQLVSDDIHYIMLITNISERKQYETLQNNFIATISHELRTPLTSILGSLNLLNSGKLVDLPSPAKKLIHITEENTHRLKHLISDIMDFSKLKTTKMSINMDYHPLSTLLETAVEEHRFYRIEKNISIIADTPPATLVYLDPQRFLQIMSNLLSNAIKFSPNQSTITLTAEILENSVSITVTDQGPGVSAEFLPMLFTPFRQQDEVSNRQFEGSGLGLAISKGLAEAMGGNITYETAENSGAAFTLHVQRNAQ